MSYSPQESFPSIVVSLFVSGQLRGVASVAAADVLDADDAAARGKFCGATLTLKLEAPEEDEDKERGEREAVAQVFGGDLFCISFKV